MPAIVCPSCGEDDALAGKRRPDDSLEVTCLSRGNVWKRGGPHAAGCAALDASLRESHPGLAIASPNRGDDLTVHRPTPLEPEDASP